MMLIKYVELTERKSEDDGEKREKCVYEGLE
jgi:hypothetical protein